MEQLKFTHAVPEFSGAKIRSPTAQWLIFVSDPLVDAVMMDTIVPGGKQLKADIPSPSLE